MRLLTHFELITEADDITGIAVTVDGDCKVFDYPACAEDGEEAAILIQFVSDAYAVHSVDFTGEDAKGWFDGWMLPDAYLLDNRVVPPDVATPAVEEMTATLTGSTETASMAGVELGGDLSGDNTSEVGSEGVEKRSSGKARKVKKRTKKLREGAGCKQPDKVNGYMAGRLLCVTKNHRSTGPKGWGRCEYRVRCNADGSYTLEHFAGSRKDVKTGDDWATASVMFKTLLALPPETKHHRMTIKRYFNL